MANRLKGNLHPSIEQLERRELLSAGLSDLLHLTVPLAAATVADDYGNTAAQAALVSLSTAGSGSKSGKIEVARDVDVFKFVAPITGQMTIQEAAATGSRLDCYLYVYNGSQQLVAYNDDYGGTLNSRVTVNVTAGATYYVKAAAFSVSVGAYTLQFSTVAAATTDDFGNTFAAAKQVSLSSSGSGSQSGRIERSGDVDMFKFVAPVSGQMTIKQSAASGSTLDSYLYVYNSSQQLVAQSDDYNGTANSQVTISVVAGTTYYVKAGAYSTSIGAYTLAFSTVASSTTPATPTQGGFQIDVTMTGFTTAQQQIVQQAVDRWEQIIVGDIPNVVYQGRTIDDLALSITAITIDGVGSILGQSAPTVVRSASYLPCLGFIQLDTADVASMQSSGSLLSVIEHEIAHVLGFGVIWSNLGLLVGASTSNPGFTGAHAMAEYNSIFGAHATSVPVEASGGSGTRLSHWSEAVFATELMTGWYNSGQVNLLSRITVAAMADLGYTVNMAAADAYTRPTSSLAASSMIVGYGTTSSTSRVASSESSRERQTDWLRAVDMLMQEDRDALHVWRDAWVEEHPDILATLRT